MPLKEAVKILIVGKSAHLGNIRYLTLGIRGQKKLGIGKAALSMIETGKCGLSTRNKNILVQDFNLNPEWIDTGEGEMFNSESDYTAFRLRTDKSFCKIRL